MMANGCKCPRLSDPGSVIICVSALVVQHVLFLIRFFLGPQERFKKMGNEEIVYSRRTSGSFIRWRKLSQGAPCFGCDQMLVLMG